MCVDFYFPTDHGIPVEQNKTNNEKRNYEKRYLFSICYKQDPDFDDMSSFFPCEIEDAIQYIILNMERRLKK